jgi:hypothetical protein
MATGMLIHDDRYLRNIFFGLVYLGAIIVLFVPGSSYFGYAIVAAGLMMIILIFFQYIVFDANQNSTGSNFSKLKVFLFSLINDGTPVFMVFGIVVYLLTVTMAFNKNIMAGDVTPQYINFRNISAIFLIIEAILLNVYLGEKRRKVVTEERAEETGSLGNRAMKILSKNIGIGLITILFATLHVLVAIIIDMNLRYFTTEGFEGQKRISKLDDLRKDSGKNKTDLRGREIRRKGRELINVKRRKGRELYRVRSDKVR